MNHPSAEKIALLAGDDLSMIEWLPVRWHLRGCQHCRQELEASRGAIQAFREESLELPAGVDWDSLASEMRGNISVGLEASQAIEAYSRPEISVFDWRARSMTFRQAASNAIFALAIGESEILFIVIECKLAIEANTLTMF